MERTSRNVRTGVLHSGQQLGVISILLVCVELKKWDCCDLAAGWWHGSSCFLRNPGSFSLYHVKLPRVISSPARSGHPSHSMSRFSPCRHIGSLANRKYVIFLANCRHATYPANRKHARHDVPPVPRVASSPAAKQIIISPATHIHIFPATRIVIPPATYIIYSPGSKG